MSCHTLKREGWGEPRCRHVQIADAAEDNPCDLCEYYRSVDTLALALSLSLASSHHRYEWIVAEGSIPDNYPNIVSPYGCVTAQQRISESTCGFLQ